MATTNHEKPEHEYASHLEQTSENMTDQIVSELDDGEIARGAIGGAVSDLPPNYYRSFKFIGTLGAVYFSYISVYFAFVIPANVLSNINEDIGPDSGYVWITIVWALSQAVTFVLLGRFSDLFGRRWFYIIGNVIGTVGSVLGGSAKSIPILIGGSALLGIAGSVQQPFAVLAELVPNKHRAAAIGILAFFTTPFAAFGPILVRLLIIHTTQGWRWSYYLCAISSGLSVILYFICYHPPTYELLHARRENDVPKWKMFDVGGIVFFVLGLCLLLLGINWGGVIYPWKSGMVIGFITGGVVVLIMLVLWEIYCAGDYPLIRMSFFRNRGYVGILGTAAVGYLTYTSLLVLWPLEITVLYGNSSIMDVGWKSTVAPCGALIGQLLSGLLLRLLGKHNWQLIIGICLITAFTGGMAGVTSFANGVPIVFILVTAIMVGYIETAVLTLGPFCLRPEDLGIALGILGTVRSTASAVAQAVFVAILNNKLIENIPKYVVPAVVSAGLSTSAVPALLEALNSGDFTGVPGITPGIVNAAVLANQQAYSKSFQVVFLAAIAFGICGLLAAFNAPNSEKHFTDVVSRRLIGSDSGKEIKDAAPTEKQKTADEV